MAKEVKNSAHSTGKIRTGVASLGAVLPPGVIIKHSDLLDRCDVRCDDGAGNSADDEVRETIPFFTDFKLSRADRCEHTRRRGHIPPPSHAKIKRKN